MRGRCSLLPDEAMQALAGCVFRPNANEATVPANGPCPSWRASGNCDKSRCLPGPQECILPSDVQVANTAARQGRMSPLWHHLFSFEHQSLDPIVTLAVPVNRLTFCHLLSAQRREEPWGRIPKSWPCSVAVCRRGSPPRRADHRLDVLRRGGGRDGAARVEDEAGCVGEDGEETGRFALDVGD